MQVILLATEELVDVLLIAIIKLDLRQLVVTKHAVIHNWKDLHILDIIDILTEPLLAMVSPCRRLQESELFEHSHLLSCKLQAEDLILQVGHELFLPLLD